jgi:hypothetical protein
VADGFDVLLNCVNKMLGPLDTLHAPIPITGVFAAKVADPVEQIVCGLPALEVVGDAITITAVLDTEAAQGALLIVHVKT